VARCSGLVTKVNLFSRATEAAIQSTQQIVSVLRFPIVPIHVRTSRPDQLGHSLCV